MLKIGTSGFSFPDWKGPVYPKEINDREMLSFYANELKMNAVEINFTYYSLPSEKSFISMQSKVPRNFTFVVKGYRGMTHDPFDDRLENKPSLEEAKENTQKFVSALKPLKGGGQLGAVLLQFPYFFHPDTKSRDYILQCKELINDIPLVIEFRNVEWAKDATIEFLRENKLGYCAVDEPKLKNLLPYRPEVTSDTAYLRFHGRNKNWFNAPVEERYNYLYKEEELKSFLPDIKKMSEKAKDTYLFFNNCHAGSAMKNAMMMRQCLEKGLGMIKSD